MLPDITSSEPGIGLLVGPWSATCGQGWIVDHLSNKCYYFSLDQQNWQDSRKTCQKMKSDLMSIESKYEQTFVQGDWWIHLLVNTFGILLMVQVQGCV